MRSLADRILDLPGVHYIVTRHGPRSLKRLAFEQKITSGEWDYAAEDREGELLEAVINHARLGRILCLGCGSGALVAALPSASYADFVGVDLSREGIKKAQRYENKKIRFELGNMADYRPVQPYDVIVFEESLYYLSIAQQQRLLARLRPWLTPSGVFIVTVSRYERFGKMLSKIRENFMMVDDRSFSNVPTRRLCVFR